MVQGFRQRFGVVEVNFETKKGYLRPNAFVFRERTRYGGVPEELSHLITFISIFPSATTQLSSM